MENLFKNWKAKTHDYSSVEFTFKRKRKRKKKRNLLKFLLKREIMWGFCMFTLLLLLLLPMSCPKCYAIIGFDQYEFGRFQCQTYKTKTSRIAIVIVIMPHPGLGMIIISNPKRASERLPIARLSRLNYVTNLWRKCVARREPHFFRRRRISPNSC